MELPYIIRVALIMAAMYLTYKIFLSKDTFHALNRAAILASVAVSFVLPLLPIPSIFAGNATPTMTTATVGMGEITAEIADYEPQMSLSDYLPYLMVTGAVAFFLRFLISTISIAIQAFRHKKITLRQGVKLILSETIKSPVSWLKYYEQCRLQRKLTRNPCPRDGAHQLPTLHRPDIHRLGVLRTMVQPRNLAVQEGIVRRARISGGQRGIGVGL